MRIAGAVLRLPEHFHVEWQRSSLWFASNFISLIRFAIPVRLILL